MLINFQVEYKTFPGQNLIMVGSIKELGYNEPSKGKYLILKEVNSGIWELKLELKAAADFSYRYMVKDDNFNTVIDEWGPDRLFRSEGRKDMKVLVVDKWRAISDPDFTLHSSAFTNAILKLEDRYPAPIAKASKEEDTVIIRFRPNVIRVKSGHRIAICGNAKSLGAWNEKKALVLGNPDHPYWVGEARVSVSDFPIHYKYLVKDENGKTAFWEKANDRTIAFAKGKTPDVIEIGDDKFDFPQYPWKGVGVAIPVFSLRRNDGFGVGEFTDLKLLVDWSVKVGIRLIQLLPINDTVAKHTWQDSYPYAAISVYAMHPIYINLLEIGELSSEINQQIIEAQGKYLNSLSKIDYEAVMALKSRFFKLIYDQKKKVFQKDPEFLEFFKENEHWLKPYAAFSYLRDLFNTPDFSRWGEYSSPSEDLLDLLTNDKASHYDDIAVHYFIQFHAHRQLLGAANYARSKGVVLKGDIPIGIYRNSVDAWLHPHLYNMNCQAGAPPDDFSNKGQNWRFPTYNWDEMAKDNYAWWQQRLRQLSHYFDAFRIDHILGFFRIWEIPSSQVEGLMGYFNPSLPYYRDELQNKGIWFDHKRLCQPYIREHFLYERFGDLTEFAKHNYLTEFYPGCYDLRPEFDTQRKIEEQIVVEPDASPDTRNRLERLRDGLYSLVSEVIFLEAPGMNGEAYFPRNTVHFTRSFQELDEHTKQIINEVYMDYFYRRNEEFWRSKAMTKLPVLKKATNMLLCGEDLGMVPACVPAVMNELGILSLEVQRMPKNPKITFGHPADYPYLSVATPSSHDTSTIRGWWEENSWVSQKFYNEILGNWGQSPFFCEPEIVQQIINQHLYSPSMWAIFPIQDLLGMDGSIRLPDANAERINQPGNPNHYWRYRMHLSIEELSELTGFNEWIRGLFQAAGRLDIY
ncbi:MAG: 4-alpha-glucanotransferase [Bacteroidetes bacterium]|nr:4-alpha-glucanotransferase [Bacteroidota bacterium]